MSDYLIQIEGLSKKYCKDLKKSLWYGVEDSAREILGVSRNPELRSKEFWALQDINIKLKRGECLGLIGHNGAGKSTLLKILNGIIKPDKGKVTMKGRVAAIIELGAGFNPALTGKENIYANGAILGLKKSEIDQLYESIVDFSELESFIHSPVRYYSSGMRVRLGFSIAIHLKPDILLLDEVLAVGDIGFRIKSLNAMARLIKETAVIFVSHSVDQIARICSSVCFLEKGNITYHGNDISYGISQYEKTIPTSGTEYIHDGLASLSNISINEIPLKVSGFCKISFGQNLQIQFELKLDSTIEKYTIKVEFADSHNRIIAHYHSLHNSVAMRYISSGKGYDLDIPNLNFTDGVYKIHFFIMDQKGVQQYYCYRNMIQLEVTGSGHQVKGFSSLLLEGNITESKNLEVLTSKK